MRRKPLVRILEEALGERGWDKKELAARAGISKNIVYNVLRERTSTTIENYMAMFDALGVSMFDAIGRTKEQFERDRETLRTILDEMDKGRFEGRIWIQYKQPDGETEKEE